MITNSPSINFRTSLFSGSLLAVGFMLLAVSCSSETDNGQAGINPGTPPSLRSSQENPVIQLSEQQAEDLDIRHYTVKREQISFEINAPGRVYGAPEGISVVSSPINGRVSKIYAHEGERVQAGDPLLDLESLEFA